MHTQVPWKMTAFVKSPGHLIRHWFLENKDPGLQMHLPEAWSITELVPHPDETHWLRLFLENPVKQTHAPVSVKYPFGVHMKAHLSSTLTNPWLQIHSTPFHNDDWGQIYWQTPFTLWKSWSTNAFNPVKDLVICTVEDTTDPIYPGKSNFTLACSSTPCLVCSTSWNTSTIWIKLLKSTQKALVQKYDSRSRSASCYSNTSSWAVRS